MVARLALMSTLRAVALLAAFAFAPGAQAHEVRPAIADVELREGLVNIVLSATVESLVAGIDLSQVEDTDEAEGADIYDALRALTPTELTMRLNEAWPDIAPSITALAGETPLTLALVGSDIAPVGDIDLPRDSVLILEAPLPDDGSAVRLGWDAANGPLIVRQTVTAGDGYNDYLTNGALSEPMPRVGQAQKSALAAFVDYIVIGFEHIIPKGLDHILFVLGLFLFSLHLRPLLYQITAFTLAHTVTLALAILGYVSVPAAIVEPLIAASIVFVAVENILFKKLTPWRTAIVFGFGLLHGLGFASVLGDIGLDPARFVTGLIGFNIGVELGQLTVIALAYLLVGLWFGKKPWYRQYITNPASAAIAVVGAYWFVERVFL